MVLSVTASEAQRNFGVLHDDAMREPVQITKHGRETVYMISAEMWQTLWQAYRVAKPISQLSAEDIEGIRNFEIGPESDYGPEDYPELEITMARPRY